MTLTHAEQAYIDTVLDKIKYSVNVTIPIRPADHSKIKGKRKDALGLHWSKLDERTDEYTSHLITIDYDAIQWAYKTQDKSFMNPCLYNLEEIIAHEIAHICIVKHGKKHTEHTRYIMKLIESGKPHGVKNSNL